MGCDLGLMRGAGAGVGLGLAWLAWLMRVGLSMRGGEGYNIG
jgi:hypothetical protein